MTGDSLSQIAADLQAAVSRFRAAADALEHYQPGPVLAATTATSQDGPLLCRVEEAAELLGIGRHKIYDLIARGELESLKLGQSRRISYAALKRYISRGEARP